MSDILFILRKIFRTLVKYRKRFYSSIIQNHSKYRISFLVMYKYLISPRLVRPENKLNRIRNRKLTFDFIVEKLNKNSELLVLETGCMRADHGDLAFGDDGCSTLIFDLLAKSCNGSNYSVDISQENINHAKKFCKNTTFIHMDSVKFLKSFQFKDKIDLLYLDSYDFETLNPEPSQQHHLSEIMAVYDQLKEGCLILIDDSDAQPDGSVIGKSFLVKKFFDEKGISPLVSDYQLLYIK